MRDGSRSASPTARTARRSRRRARRSASARSQIASASAVIFSRGTCASTRPRRTPFNASSRSAASGFAVRRAADRERIRGIGAGNGGEQQRRVRHRARERTVGVEIRPGRDDAGARHEPERRLHADDAGADGRNPVGAAVVCAERGERHAAGDRDRRSGAGPAGRASAGGIVRDCAPARCGCSCPHRGRRSRLRPSCRARSRQRRAAATLRSRRAAPVPGTASPTRRSTRWSAARSCRRSPWRTRARRRAARASCDCAGGHQRPSRRRSPSPTGRRWRAMPCRRCGSARARGR